MLFGSDLTFFAGIPHYKTLFKQLLLVFFMPINDECFLLKPHPRTLKKDHFSRSNTHTRDCSTSTKRGAITISVFQIWTVPNSSFFFALGSVVGLQMWFCHENTLLQPLWNTTRNAADVKVTEYLTLERKKNWIHLLIFILKRKKRKKREVITQKNIKLGGSR